MATETVTVTGGVDTHKHTHYAAAVDDQGRLLGHREFPATGSGYLPLLAWMRGHGQVTAIGVEGTGSFGAALTRALTAAGEQVVEVNRPSRPARRMDGKSDRLDAEQVARAVLGQVSTAVPKAKSGMVEVIRTLRVTRASAVKARTQAFNTLWGVMIGAPSPLRDELVVLGKRTLVNRCPGLRPETSDLLALRGDPARPGGAGPHDARPTAATLLLEQGVGIRVVEQMLGHSQVSQTERDTHVTTQLGRDAAGDGRRLWDASAQLQPEINSRPAQSPPDSRKPAAQ